MAASQGHHATVEPRDYGIPEELLAVLARFDDFLRTVIRPLEAASTSIGDDAVATVRRRAGQARLYAPHFTREEGGLGLGVLGTALLVEQAARSGSVLARAAVAPPAPSGPSPVLRLLPEALRTKYLAPLVRGDQTMCFALTEPDAGSDLRRLRTEARRADETWVINGEKAYVTNGDQAAFALLIARTSRSGNLFADLTAFVVPRDRYRVVRRHQTIGDVHPVTIALDDATVPQDHVVQPPGSGMRAMLSFLDTGRVYIAAQALGLAQWCWEQAIGFALRREVSGGPIARLQGVSFPLVDCATEIEAMRALTYATASRIDRGTASLIDSSMLKLFSTERSFLVADRCMQVLGARGMDRDHGMESVLRYLRLLRVVEGTSELQRHVIAQLLGLEAA